MLKFIRSFLEGPQPTGSPEVARSFGNQEPTLGQESIRSTTDGWIVETNENKTIHLFELPGLEFEQCLVTYRAMMKSELSSGRAFLEMWCCVPDRGAFFSKGLQNAISGATDWSLFEIPFYLRKGQRPDLLKLNLAVEGKGIVWIKDIQILRTPLSS